MVRRALDIDGNRYKRPWKRVIHTPAGIVHSWNFMSSLGATLGRREVTTLDRRNASVTAADCEDVR